MTRKEFEKYIHENKLESLFTRDCDGLWGFEITLKYCDSNKYVTSSGYGCVQDEMGWHCDSCVPGERGDETGCVHSDYFETEEEALDELKRIVDFYKGYTVVHSYTESVNNFLKKTAGKSIEPPFKPNWNHQNYDISFAELDCLIKELFPGCSYTYDFDSDQKINIIAPEHVRILSLVAGFGKAVYWEFEDKKFIMFNKLGGTFCNYQCDESGIYSLYYNAMEILIKYDYDGSVIYAIKRGVFDCSEALFNPNFFSTWPIFDEKYPTKKYLGVSDGTVSIIFERATGKIVNAVKITREQAQ